MVREFRRLFPDRPDPLTLEDLDMFRSLLPLWKRLFAEYDLVQTYATDPILPLLAGKRPYVAFEHGTLRDVPFAPTQVGRTTAIGYALADGVFITNGDCLKSVAPLKIKRYAPMVHPLDERDYARIEGLGRRLHEKLGARHLFLCTLRHDWTVKGTDVYLRALPLLCEAFGPTFKLLLARWGGQVRESEELLRSLGVESLVHWIEPLPRRALIRYQKSVDVQFDQVALPHFGATAPEAMAAGVPVLMSYDPASTSWIVPEPAPILTVWTPADVVAKTLVALDPAWRLEYRRRAERWIREYHSSKRVVEGHVAMYRAVLAPRPAAEEAQ
jgi:glycosyltransferase involved in cell wall biosynthesis